MAVGWSWRDENRRADQRSRMWPSGSCQDDIQLGWLRCLDAMLERDATLRDGLAAAGWPQTGRVDGIQRLKARLVDLDIGIVRAVHDSPAIGLIWLQQRARGQVQLLTREVGAQRQAGPFEHRELRRHRCQPRLHGHMPTIR